MNMTCEDAIESLNGCIVSEEYENGKANGNITCDLTREILDMAIAALREKQAREKGCEYCNDPDTEYGAISFPRTETGEVDINKVEAVEAGFCPMCGRELRPKEA